MKYENFLGIVAARFAITRSKRRLNEKTRDAEARASRKLRLEALENRELLAADLLTGATLGAGALPPADEYAAIRDAYPALELPETVNVIEIDSTNLTVDALKAAIAKAGTTEQDDLIVVRTTDDANTIVYSGADDVIGVNIDSSTYGAVNIVAVGTQPLTLDAARNSRVLGVFNGKVGLANLTITGGNADNGGGIFVGKNGVLTSTNSTIYNNWAEYGGGVVVLGAFTASNATFADNLASHGGGAYVYKTGSFTATESTFVDNEAVYGGGVYAYTSGDIQATNSSFFGNLALKGGGVYVYQGSAFTGTNLTIAGNSAEDQGGGVFVYQTGVFTTVNSILSSNYGGDLSGELSESSKNNLIDGDPSFVCAPEFDESGLLLNFDSLDLRLHSGSSAIDKGDNQSAYAAGLTVDSTDMAGAPRFVGSAIDIGAYEYQFNPTVVDTLNDSFDPNDGEWSLREAIAYATDYVTITFADDLSGTIDLTLGELTVDKALAIDGDGRIVIDAGGDSRVARVSAGTTEAPVLFNGLTLQNGNADRGGGVYVDWGGVCTLTNSTIMDNEATYGGGVYVCRKGSFTATNSSVSNNSAVGNGGGVYVYKYGEFTATSSTLDYNSATVNGGGVYLGYGSDFTASDLTVSENWATYGGGVYCSGTITTTNATISENLASVMGGGVYLNNGGVFTATYSTISNNLSDYAGGVYVGGTFTATDSAISNNQGAHGGGAYVYADGVFTATNSIISDNSGYDETPSYGGGVYVYNGGKLIAEASTFSDNSALKGGGVYVYNGGYFTATNSTISDNSALDLGGGVYLGVGTFTATNTDIVGNSANGGGGVYVYPVGVFIATDSTISENSATYGGGVYVYGSFIAENLTVSNNSASMGGGVYVYKNSGYFYATNVAFNGNRADYGGGVEVIGTFEATNSTFSNNSASHGAGVFVYRRGSFTATDSIFVGNSASMGGGVYVYTGGEAAATNSSFFGNSATKGGGVYVYKDGTFTATNLTIAGNSATKDGGGVYVYSIEDSTPGVFTATNSILSSNYGAGLSGKLSESSKNNLIDEDPLFVCAPEFDEDGVLLNLDSLDLSLLDDSIAIDNGDNQSAYDAGLTDDSTDLAYNPRFVGSAIDIGAYEFQSVAAASALRQNMQIREIPDELPLVDAELINGVFEDSDFDLFEEE